MANGEVGKGAMKARRQKIGRASASRRELVLTGMCVIPFCSLAPGQEADKCNATTLGPVRKKAPLVREQLEVEESADVYQILCQKRHFWNVHCLTAMCEANRVLLLAPGYPVPASGPVKIPGFLVPTGASMVTEVRVNPASAGRAHL